MTYPHHPIQLGRFDIFLGWMRDQQWFWRIMPNWAQQWRARSQMQFLRKTLLPFLNSAQNAEIGREMSWAEPGTPITEVLCWCDAQLATIPHSRPLDWCKVVVAHATEEAWAHLESADLSIPEHAITAVWFGPRGDWWRNGRDHIEKALPQRHDGLVVIVHRVGAAFATLLEA